MYRNFLSVGGFTALSRLTGFARDLMIGAVMGVGPLADAFVVALRLPNQFRAIFGEGAFNSAYVPTYSRVLVAPGRRRPPIVSPAASSPCCCISQIVLLVAALVYTDATRRADRAGLLRAPGEVRARRRHDAHHLPLSRLHHAGDAAQRHAQCARLFQRRRLRAGAAQSVRRRDSSPSPSSFPTPARRRAGACSSPASPSSRC